MQKAKYILSIRKSFMNGFIVILTEEKLHSSKLE